VHLALQKGEVSYDFEFQVAETTPGEGKDRLVSTYITEGRTSTGKRKKKGKGLPGKYAAESRPIHLTRWKRPGPKTFI